MDIVTIWISDKVSFLFFFNNLVFRKNIIFNILFFVKDVDNLYENFLRILNIEEYL